MAKNWWPVGEDGKWADERRNKAVSHTEPPRITGIFKIEKFFSDFCLKAVEINESSEISMEDLTHMPRLRIFPSDLLPFINNCVKGIIRGTIRYSRKGRIYCVKLEDIY